MIIGIMFVNNNNDFRIYHEFEGLTGTGLIFVKLIGLPLGIYGII